MYYGLKKRWNLNNIAAYILREMDTNNSGGFDLVRYYIYFLLFIQIPRARDRRPTL